MISRILRYGRLILQPGVTEFSISVMSGVLIAAWLHQAVALTGTSRTAVTSLFLVVAVSIVAGFAAARWLSTTTQPRLSRNPLLLPLSLMFLAGVMSGQVSKLEGALFAAMAPAGTWPDVVDRFLMFFAAHSVLIIPLSAAVCASILPLRRQCWGLTARPLVGISFGIVLASCGLLPLLGAEYAGIAAAVASAFLGVVVFWLSRRRDLSAIPETDSHTLSNIPDGSRVQRAFFATMYGVAFVCVSRILDQLFLDAAWITAIKFASVLVGAAIGVRLAHRRSLAESAPLWMAMCLAATAALFPVGIRASLEISAYVSQSVGVALGRTAIIAAALVPLGAAFALSSAKANDRHSVSSCTIAAFICGMIIARWLVVTSIGPVAGLASVAAGLTVLACVSFLVTHGIRSLPARPAFSAGSVAGLIAVATVPLWAPQYRPDRSARILFDTGVFLAHRVELRTEILEHLDEARCLGTREAEATTLSLWRSRGTRLQLRESGMPRSSIDVSPGLAPQPSGEALQAILPLVLHEKPASILILGLGTGATLQTSLQFPVSQISCVESDSTLIEFVSKRVLSRLSPNPLNDERVEIVNCEPVAATASAKNFDVIVCSTNHLSQPGSATEATTEFLTRAAGGLTEQGLFCQQFRYVDFGADTVRSVLATWHSVFEHVAAVETAPGEWLLIGTPDSAGIYREGFVERLQRQHVRHALSGLGFDWATPLQLTVFDGDLLQQHFEQSRQNGGGSQHIQTTASASMLAAGPWDVMRWGAKFTEVQQSVGPVARRLATVFPDETSNADVKRRVSELDARRDLIHKGADRYWGYRAELKKRLKESPRADIVQVSGGQKTRLHPEEQRRIDYFKSLGHAAGFEKPTTEALRSVEKFAAPYDPLVSFFMHQEIAELAARNSVANAAVEFRHRLYRVNFTSSRDRSIRNLIAAIHLLCDHSELIPDDAERGDQLDAFLQILHQRWQNRGDIGPESSVVALNDIQKSLDAGERAFDVLEQVAAARDKSDDELALRKLAIEKSLMRPLRTYRKRLMRHKDVEQAIRSR